MKYLLSAAMLAAIGASAQAADVGLSINVSQPGFYGQINIGNVAAPPQLIYTQPVVVARDPHYVAEPVYLHVPPGYERHWARHCGEYNACGRPVYFVRDDWYKREYAPRYEHHEEHRDEHREDQGHHHEHD